MNIKDIIVIASCRHTSVRHLKFSAIRVPNNESLRKIGLMYWCTVFKLCSIRILLHFHYWISHAHLRTKDYIYIYLIIPLLTVKNIWRSYIWTADKDMNESDLRSDVHYLGSSENKYFYDLHIFLTVYSSLHGFI